MQNKSAFSKHSNPSQNEIMTPGGLNQAADHMFGNFSSAIQKDNFGHKDIVTELLMLPKLQYLASCSLDKKVILWDTITGEQKRVYTEHTMVSS